MSFKTGQQARYLPVTSAYACTYYDDVVQCDATSASFIVTLPDATLVPGKQLALLKLDSTANVITLQTTSAQTVGGIASGKILLATQNDSIQIVSNGTNWQIISINIKIYLEYSAGTGFGGGTALTANVTNIPFNNKVVDPYSAWSGTVFTAPRPSLYFIQGIITSTTGVGGPDIFLYNNNSVVKMLFASLSSSSNMLFNGSKYLNLGDQVSIRTDTAYTTGSNSQANWITISSQN